MNIFVSISIALIILGECRCDIDPATLFITKVQVTYNEALQACRSYGMRLVRITSSEENNVVNGFANQMLADAYWIDGNDHTAEGTWVDSQGQDLSFKNFAPALPDGGRAENCINVFRLPSGLWNDYNCVARLWAICQRDTDMLSTIDPSELSIEGNKMIVSNSRMTYAEAQDYCVKRGLKMVYIKNSLDNSVVHDFARETVSDLYWIDANDISKEGTWVDNDGKPLIHKNFVPGEPNGGRVENCGHGYLHVDGLWNDYPCDAKLWAICYRRKRRQRLDPNFLIKSSERLTFTEAQDYCKSQELKLVKPNNAAENAYIHGYARRTVSDLYWLDGNDAKVEGRWVDSDDNDLKHKNFHPGEPNGGRSENCINGYLTVDGLWNDFPCTYKNLFAICSMGDLQLPNADDYRIISEFLIASTEKYSYNEALQFCRTRGAQLARINNEEDNNVIAAFAKKVVAHYYWIDGNDHTEDGKWVNSNGNPLNYKNFAVHEPNGGKGENCLYSYYLEEGTWRDGVCTNKISAVCSLNPS